MVIMRNDVACQMVGIGTIQIKMFDGVVRNLTDMRYVPQMKKNIISVKALWFTNIAYLMPHIHILILIKLCYLTL